MDEPLDRPCANCGKAIQTLWCLTWDAYLCMWCRARRTDHELNTKPRTLWPGFAAVRR